MTLAALSLTRGYQKCTPWLVSEAVSSCMCPHDQWYMHHLQFVRMELSNHSSVEWNQKELSGELLNKMNTLHMTDYILDIRLMTFLWSCIFCKRIQNFGLINDIRFRLLGVQNCQNWTTISIHIIHKFIYQLTKLLY